MPPTTSERGHGDTYSLRTGACGSSDADSAARARPWRTLEENDHDDGAVVPRWLVWLRRLAIALLVVDALDLTTSAIPALIDQPRAVPPRSPAALLVQLVLLLPLVALLPSALRAAWRRFAALPIPVVARALVAGFVLLELAHVALRAEIYPFSPIAMFSNALPPRRGPTAAARALRLPGDPEPFGLLRAGSELGSRGFDLDYKAAWVLRLYEGSPTIDPVVREQLGGGHARLERFTFRTADGRIVAASPIR